MSAKDRARLRIILAAITLLSVQLLTSNLAAQDSRFRNLFDQVVAEAANHDDFYQRLIAAENDLIAAVDDPALKPGALEQTLSETLAELMQVHDAAIRNKLPDQRRVPPGFIDRVTAVMLVAMLPEVDLADLKVNRNGRDVDFTSQMIYLVRSNYVGIGGQIQAPGPLRDIASEWLKFAAGSWQGHQMLYWGLQYNLRDACLTVARRILARRRDPTFWNGPNVKPQSRDYLLRAPIAVVEKWGGKSDCWALMKIVYEPPDTDPATGKVVRTTAKDQALGALIHMNDLQPTDYRLRKSFGIFNNYRFNSPEDQAAAQARFKAWWDFLQPWDADDSHPAEMADLDLESAVDSILNDQFPEVADKRRVVRRIEQEPEAAEPLLRAARQSASQDQAMIIDVMLDRIATRFADQLGSQQPDAPSVQSARQAYAVLLGQDGQTPLFDEMIKAEPGLIAAFSQYLDAPTASHDFYRDVLVRVFMRRESESAMRFYQLRSEFAIKLNKSGIQKADAAALYPANLDDEFFASLAAILFVRGQRADQIPTPLMGLVNQSLFSGLGVNQQRSPVLAFMRSTGPRGAALRECLQSACLAAQDPSEYTNALSIAMRYRLQETSLTLARRICDPAFEFPSVAVRGSLMQLAVHTFMIFGSSHEDLSIVASLLKDEQPIRLGGNAAGQKRRHIEVREFALIAAKRMLGRNPEAMQGAKVNGYCPVKGKVAVEIIEDPQRWQAIEKTVNNWVAEFATNK